MVFSQETRYKVLSAVDWTLVSFSKSQDVKKNKNICIIGDVRTFSHALQGNTHTHTHTHAGISAGKTKIFIFIEKIWREQLKELRRGRLVVLLELRRVFWLLTRYV